MTYAISEKREHTRRDYETINKISCIPYARLQVAAERLENPYVTTNSFHFGPSFLCTSLDVLQRMVLASSTRPWRAQASLGMPDKRAVLEIILPFCPAFMLLPLLLYYNLNFIFFSSFISSGWKKQAEQNNNNSSKPANAARKSWTNSQVYSTTIRCLLWHFSLLPVPSTQYSVFIPLTLLHCLLLPFFSFWEPFPLSLPPPSSLCMMWLDRRIQIYVFSTRASHFFPIHLWLLISPSRRWVSLSSLLPFSLTFPLLLLRHSLMLWNIHVVSYCEMISLTLSWLYL